MRNPNSDPESSVFEVLSSAFKNGQLNYENRKHLKSLLSTDSLSENDLRVINRLFSAIRRCRYRSSEPSQPKP